MATTVFIVSGTSYVVPANCSLADSVEVIGAGGGGGSGNASGSFSGAGGGAYSKITSLALTPSASVTVQVGAGGAGGGAGSAGTGTDAWFNGASLAASSVGAKGGIGGAAGGAPGGAGGAASGGIGPFRYAILYNSSASNKVFGYYDYGASGLTLASGESLTVDFDAAAGAFTIS